MFVAYTPELDVSSCGNSLDEARKNLKDAVVGFLESAYDRGVLDEILQEAGYSKQNWGTERRWISPELLMLEKSNVSFQHA